MKMRAALASTAIIFASFVPVLNAPAWANPDPIQDTSGMSPQEVCDLQLKPNNPNSDFQAEPVEVVVGDWVIVSTEIGDAIGEAYGVGTPTFSDVFLGNSYFRNGGSPNVWALATATETFPQTGQMHETEVTQQQTSTFGCHVFKFNGPDDQHLVEPEGLQTVGNSAVEEQVLPGDPQEVITEDDYIIEGQTVKALICISPNNATKGKPGTWTQKHGFTGSCAEASLAAGGIVPSGNAPDLP